MQIYIKTLTGKHFPIEVESNDTIQIVKKKVFEKDPVLHPDSNRVLFDNKMMEDETKTLIDYNIGKDATLNYIQRMRSVENTNDN